MNLVIRSATMASVLALGVVGANAADLTYEPAPVAPIAEAFNWTGFYIGVHGGIGGGTFDLPSLQSTQPTLLDNSDALTIVTPYGSEDINATAFGGFGGAQIGYNYQFSPNWVIGAEADIALSNIEAKVDYSNDDAYIINSSDSTEVEWFGTIRGRLGYAMDNVLFYGTGGVAYGSVKTSSSYTYYDGYNESWSASDTKWGWTAGAGVEYGITKNITLKAEYLYVDLGSSSFDLSDAGYPDGSVLNVDTAFHTLKAGLNYKF